jgi:autotransporter-associated beta strand protein
VIEGGVFNANGGGTPRNMVIAEQGSTGVLTINGGTVNANNSTAGSAIGGNYYGILMTGTAADNGTLNLNGGTLLLSRITALDATAPSVFNFNGGLLKANNSFSNFMQGLSRANVRDGGAVIDTNGNDITIYQSLLHSDISGDAAIDGGVTKLGAGNLQLAGYNEYTGDTVVGGGSLTLYDGFLHDESHVSIAAGATLDLQSGMEDTVKTLVIGGVPAAPGTWGAVDSVDADFTTPAITGSGLLKVTTLGTASAYEAWAAENGLAGPNALASADPDGDGASNMLEFALNGDPGDGSNPGLTHASIQDASAPAGNELTLTIAVRDGATFALVDGAQRGTASGYAYTVQGTQDLDAYGSAVSHVSVSDTAPGLPSLAGTPWEYHTFKLDASEGLPGKGFLRVKVETAP